MINVLFLLKSIFFLYYKSTDNYYLGVLLTTILVEKSAKNLKLVMLRKINDYQSEHFIPSVAGELKN